MTDVLTRPGEREPMTVGARRTARTPGDAGTGHPLTRLLRGAARRCLPPADGTVEVCPAPPGPCDAAVVFTGYSMVAADVPEDWVREHVAHGRSGDGGLHGAVSAHFLEALADRLGVPTPGVNVLLAAPKPPQAGPRAAVRPSDRIRNDWAVYRSDVVCYTDREGTGVITIGRGPGGRLDLSIDLEGAERPWLRGSTVVQGRELIEAARTIAAGDLFASVPAYDAAALRTYLCGGFRAIGAEALFLTRPAPRPTPTWFP